MRDAWASCPAFPSFDTRCRLVGAVCTRIEAGPGAQKSVYMSVLMRLLISRNSSMVTNPQLVSWCPRPLSILQNWQCASAGYLLHLCYNWFSATTHRHVPFSTALHYHSRATRGATSQPSLLPLFHRAFVQCVLDTVDADPTLGRVYLHVQVTQCRTRICERLRV